MNNQTDTISLVVGSGTYSMDLKRNAFLDFTNISIRMNGTLSNEIYSEKSREFERDYRN